MYTLIPNLPYQSSNQSYSFHAHVLYAFSRENSCAMDDAQDQERAMLYYGVTMNYDASSHLHPTTF